MSEQFIERRICIGAITSTGYLRTVYSDFSPELLTSQAASTIFTWCLEHFAKHNKAPGKDIELIFGAYSRKRSIDEDQADDIKAILESLSGEYSTMEFDLAVLVDETISYFEERRVDILADSLKYDIENGDIKAALQSIDNYRPIDQKPKADPDFFADDQERTRKIFEEVAIPIVEYPGKLGKLWNRHFVRGGFVGLLGSEKCGKTWTLMDIAFQALKSGRNVAFFGAGDMNREEMELRKYIRLCQRSNDREFCGELLMPVLDCWKNQNGECFSSPGCSPFANKDFPKDWKAKDYENIFETYEAHVPCTSCIGTPEYRGAPWYERKESCDPITWKEGYNREVGFKKRIRGGGFRISCHETDTLTPKMIDNQLAVWAEEGFEVDVSLYDYPDIMAKDPDGNKFDFRHGENSKWKRLRGLSHKWNMLGVAATQADGNALGEKWLDLKNYSEEKRKYSHATAFFGLNQTDDEAELGLFRINQLMVRSGKRGRRFATVLQRLEIGRPHLGSF